MDLSLTQTSPVGGSKNNKKRRRQRVKHKAMGQNETKASDRMDDNVGASNKVSECIVTSCAEEENLPEKDLNNQELIENPKIALGSTENSSEGNKVVKKKKKRKKIKKTTVEVIVDVQSMEAMDANQVVTGSAENVAETQVVTGSTENVAETQGDIRSTENAAEGNVARKRKRRPKKKKRKVQTADQVDDTLTLQSSKENNVEEIAGELTENNVEKIELAVGKEYTLNHSDDFDNPFISSSKVGQENDISLEISEHKEAVVSADVIVVPSTRTSTESGEISGNLMRPMELDEKKLLLESQNDSQSKQTATEAECLLQGIVQSPGVAAMTSRRRKLIVLDVNGLLANIVMPAPKDRRGDIHILGRAIFRRPFCDEFLQFCFQNFDVAIWSSRSKKIIDRVVEYLLGDLKNKLLFCWDMEHSTQTGYRTLENHHKPLVCKELRKIWENADPQLPWKKGDYDESNTLLLDDSPYKALLNPLNTAIFPKSYNYEDKNDNSLGPGGDIRVYLEGLLASDNVQKYVEQHPFGQSAINETDTSWNFYSGVLQTISNRVENNTPVSLSTVS